MSTVKLAHKLRPGAREPQSLDDSESELVPIVQREYSLSN
jgi:hypothetical protein